MDTRPVSPSLRKEIGHYLNLDESALLALMGGHKSLHAFGETTQAWELGMSWYEHAEVLFYGQLCVQDKICASLSQPGFSDDVSLVWSIADAICAFTDDIPPFAVAAFMVKRGIRQFCHCGGEMDDGRRFRILGHAVKWYTKLTQDMAQAERDLEVLAELMVRRLLCYSVIETLYTSKHERLLKAYQVPLP